MQLTSSAFEHNTSIPPLYTCNGNKTKSPPLSISGVPSEAQSLVLIMDDPDVPKQLKADKVFVHWILFNIPRETTEIPEGGSIGTLGSNSVGDNSYTGPCPPSQYEPYEHRYFFKLYALDTKLNSLERGDKQEVLDSMQGHIIAKTELVGKYKQQ